MSFKFPVEVSNWELATWILKPLRMRYRQYSVKELLLLTLGVAIACGLIVQIRLAGLVISGYLLGMWFGWRTENVRVGLTSLTCFLIFGVGYAACWLQMGGMEPLEQVAMERRALLLSFLASTMGGAIWFTARANQSGSRTAQIVGVSIIVVLFSSFVFLCSGTF